MRVCTKCKGTTFSAHMLQRRYVVVDSCNNWIEDEECYDSEKPYGPYTCRKCGAEYDSLDELEEEMMKTDPL